MLEGNSSKSLMKLVIAGFVIICQENNRVSADCCQGPMVRSQVVCF